MQTGIDTLTSYTTWKRLYELLPDDRRSPFFSPEYHLAYKAIDQAPAYCFWCFEDEKNFLFYPFLKKGVNSLGYDLDKEYCDIIGVYNYNGPLGVVSDPDFTAVFNRLLQDYLLSENVVTEFVRYCPITENRLYHSYTEQIDVLDNIYVGLSKGLEYIWSNSYVQKLRTSIRKGASIGLYSRTYSGLSSTDDLISVIHQIYTSTMQRNQADEFYYFSLGFIHSLLDSMAENTLIIVTYLGETAISFELVIYDGNLSFALMRGTLSEYFYANPNTFQTNELLIKLMGKGINTYSMGGGSLRGDSIYKFKKSFARDCDSPFYIGTKIHIPEVYKQLVSQWRELYPDLASKYGQRLQGYRLQS